MATKLQTFFENLQEQIQAIDNELCQTEEHGIPLLDKFKLLATTFRSLWSFEPLQPTELQSAEEPQMLLEGKYIDERLLDSSPITELKCATVEDVEEETLSFSDQMETPEISEDFLELSMFGTPPELFEQLPESHWQRPGVPVETLETSDVSMLSLDKHNSVDHISTDHDFLDQLFASDSVDVSETIASHAGYPQEENDELTDHEDDSAESISIDARDKSATPVSEPDSDQLSDQIVDTRHNLRPRPSNKRKNLESTSSSRHHKRRKKTPSLGGDESALEMLAPLLQNIIEPVKLHQRFVKQSRSKDTDGLWTITRLFYAIASPEAFYQLKDMYFVVQADGRFRSPHSSDSVADTMMALNNLDIVASTHGIFRRYHLVRLRQHRKQTGRELASLMKELYPDLPQPERLDDATSDYKTKYKLLKNRLIAGRNWETLQVRFPGILPLVPVEGYFGLHNSEIERITTPLFSILIDALEEFRGDFLKRVGIAISSIMQEMFQGQNASRNRKFETLEARALDGVEYDSEEIINMAIE